MELDKHAEQEFAVGETVIVTHSEPRCHCRRGEVLTVMSEAFIWWAGGIADDWEMVGAPEMNGWKFQALKHLQSDVMAAHPVVWLRRFEDPDGETLTTEQREEQPA